MRCGVVRCGVVWCGVVSAGVGIMLARGVVGGFIRRDRPCVRPRCGVLSAGGGIVLACDAVFCPQGEVLC